MIKTVTLYQLPTPDKPHRLEGLVASDEDSRPSLEAIAKEYQERRATKIKGYTNADGFEKGQLQDGTGDETEKKKATVSNPITGTGMPTFFSGAGLKRVRDKSDREDENEDGNERRPRRRRGDLRSLGRRLACPYAKGDPDSHVTCWTINRQNLAGVKQHLKRFHCGGALTSSLRAARSWDEVFEDIYPNWDSRKKRPSPYVDMLDIFQRSVRPSSGGLGSSATNTGPLSSSQLSGSHYLTHLDPYNSSTATYGIKAKLSHYRDNSLESLSHNHPADKITNEPTYSAPPSDDILLDDFCTNGIELAQRWSFLNLFPNEGFSGVLGENRGPSFLFPSSGFNPGPEATLGFDFATKNLPESDQSLNNTALGREGTACLKSNTSSRSRTDSGYRSYCRATYDLESGSKSHLGSHFDDAPTISSDNLARSLVDPRPEVSEWISAARDSLGLQHQDEATSSLPGIRMQLASDALRILIGSDCHIETDQDVLYALMGTIIKCGNPGSRLQLVEKLDALANISATGSENKTDDSPSDILVSISPNDEMPHCRYGHPIKLKQAIEADGINHLAAIAGKHETMDDESGRTFDERMTKKEDTSLGRPEEANNKLESKKLLTLEEGSPSSPEVEPSASDSPGSNTSEEMFKVAAAYIHLEMLSSAGKFNQCTGSNEHSQPNKNQPADLSSNQGHRTVGKDAPSRKKRKLQDDPNESDGDDEPADSNSKDIKAIIEELKGRLACPYAKGDPVKYKNCLLINCKNLARVKEHLKRKHPDKNRPDLLTYRSWVSVFDLCFPEWDSGTKPSPSYETNVLFEKSVRCTQEQKRRRTDDLAARISELEPILEMPDIKTGLINYIESLRRQIEPEVSLSRDLAVERQLSNEQPTCNHLADKIATNNTSAQPVMGHPPSFDLIGDTTSEPYNGTSATLELNRDEIRNTNLPNIDMDDFFDFLSNGFTTQPTGADTNTRSTINQTPSSVSTSTPQYCGTTGEWLSTPTSLMTSLNRATPTSSQYGQSGGSGLLYTLSIQRIPRGFQKLDTLPPEASGPKEFHYRSIDEFKSGFDGWLGAVFTNPPFSRTNSALVNVRTECSLQDISAVWQDIQHTLRATSSKSSALDLVFQG
ncbi:hypothetical protein H072_11322 [Dactylellina haptotyla CBS 200.50]|uniref:C2H2-type domain-containing protein n=1 Tax=Dactylellina haptotyla (strain CBS 200.50) TaxID=1284197 RepID=S8BJE5_DACHA|nr:hypothetical protein H072_11322 [Dactylellina haptotyla CBS 200.50]